MNNSSNYSFRNERVFEIVPQYQRLIEGNGELNLKQILGPNQYGFTLNQGNEYPEMVYRIPKEWPNSKILPITDNTYTYFIPKYGNAVLSSLDIRYSGASWHLPRLIKDRNGTQLYESTPFTTKDFNELGLLDVTGDVSQIGIFATNRQVLSYIYNVILGLATSPLDTAAKEIIKFNDVTGDNTNINANLSRELRDRIVWILKSEQDTSFITQTDFNAHKSNVQASIDALSNSQVTIVPTQDIEGMIAVFDSNKTLRGMPLTDISFLNNTLQAPKMAAPYIATSEIESTGPLALTGTSVDFVLPAGQASFSGGGGRLSLSLDNKQILSGNDTEIVLPTKITNALDSTFVLMNKARYNDPASTIPESDLMIPSTGDVKTLIAANKLSVVGAANGFMFKTSDSTITSGFLNLTPGTNNIDVNTNEIGHFGTTRVLADVSDDAFLTNSEIVSLVDASILSYSPPIAALTAAGNGEILIARNNKVVEDNSMLIVPTVMYINFIDDSVQYNYNFKTNIKINPESVIISKGFSTRPSRASFKPLTYISTLVADNRYKDLQYYVPNNSEIISELNSRELDIYSVIRAEDKLRPLISMATYTNGDEGIMPSSGSNIGFDPHTNSGDTRNAIMIHSTDINGNPAVRYYAPIKVMGTPLDSDDVSVNARLARLANDDTFRWENDTKNYENVNINFNPNSSNTSIIKVNPTKISILNYIGNDTDVSPGTPSSLYTMISPLSYTFSDDYISKFMVMGQSLTDGRSVAQVINNTLSNHLMYTPRDIMPKVAVETLTQDLITISGGAYGAIKSDDYYYYFNPVTSGKIANPNNSESIELTYVAEKYNDKDIFRMCRGSFYLSADGAVPVLGQDIHKDLLSKVNKIYISTRDTKGNDYQYMLDNLVNTDYMDIEIMDQGDDIRMARSVIGVMRLYFGLSSAANITKYTTDSKANLYLPTYWTGRGITLKNGDQVLVSQSFSEKIYTLNDKNNIASVSSWDELDTPLQYKVFPAFEGYGAALSTSGWATTPHDVNDLTIPVKLIADSHNLIYSIPVARVELINYTMNPSDWLMSEMTADTIRYTNRIKTWISPKRIISTSIESIPNLQAVTSVGATTANTIIANRVKVGVVSALGENIGYGIQAQDELSDFIFSSKLGSVHIAASDSSFFGVKVSSNSNSMFINDNYRIGTELTIKPRTIFTTRVSGLAPQEPGDFVTQQWILDEITGGLIGSKINLASVLKAGNDGLQGNMTNVGRINSETTGSLSSMEGVWSVRAPRKSTFINLQSSVVKVACAAITAGVFANEALTGDYGYDSTITVSGWAPGKTPTSFPVYRLASAPGGNTKDWYVIRFGYYWVIADTKTNVTWDNVAYSYLATKEQSPTAIYSGLANNSVTSKANINFFDASQIDVALPFDPLCDSLVADGSIYSNKSMKSRLGFITDGASYFDDAIIKTPTVTAGIQFVMEYTDFGTATLNNSTILSIDDAPMTAITTKEWVRDAINDVIPIWYPYNIGDEIMIGSDEVIIEGRLTTPDTSIMSIIGHMIAASIDTRVIGSGQQEDGELNTLVYKANTNIDSTLLESTFVYIELRGMGNIHYKGRIETANSTKLIVKEFSGLMLGSAFRMLLTQGTGSLKFKRGSSVR